MRQALLNRPSPAPSDSVAAPAPQRELQMLDLRSVMELWHHINVLLLGSLPPLAEVAPWTEERLLLAINRGLLAVWVYSEERRILAVLTTQPTGDVITGGRALLVYSSHSFGGLSTDDWQNIYSALREYARKMTMTKIVAVTNVQRVVNIFAELGGDTTHRLCELEV